MFIVRGASARANRCEASRRERGAPQEDGASVAQVWRAKANGRGGLGVGKTKTKTKTNANANANANANTNTNTNRV